MSIFKKSWNEDPFLIEQSDFTCWDKLSPKGIGLHGTTYFSKMSSWERKASGRRTKGIEVEVRTGGEGGRGVDKKNTLAKD